MSKEIIIPHSLYEVRRQCGDILNRRNSVLRRMDDDTLSELEKEILLDQSIELTCEYNNLHREFIQSFKKREQEDWDAYIDAKPNNPRRFFKRDHHDRNIYNF